MPLHDFFFPPFFVSAGLDFTLLFSSAGNATSLLTTSHTKQEQQQKYKSR